MGAEDFQIRLQLNPVLTTGALELFLQSEGFVEDDDSFSNRIAGAHYLILDQPEFVLEAELRDWATGVQLSLRYAVCQPSVADECAAIILWKLRSNCHEFQFVDCDADPAMFEFSSFSEFRTWLSRNADAKRTLWFAEFPGPTVKTSCRSAFDHYL